MKKITVKNLIEFRKRNERTRTTFINNLKKEKRKSSEDSGGDYWISCLSAIRNVFKFENKDLLDQKIDLLMEKKQVAEIKRIKEQFQRNIDILSSFKEFDFQMIKPNSKLVFLKQPKNISILDINGLPIEAKPCHLFSFSENDIEEVGGIWFVAKLGGFKKSELGMFADIIYRYCGRYYSKNFNVNPDYCIAIDVFNAKEIRYSDILKGDIPTLIDKTIEEIKKI